MNKRVLPPKRKKAQDVKPGDVVVCSNERFNYVVESVEETGIGGIRHRSGNNTASHYYQPNEYLWTR